MLADRQQTLLEPGDRDTRQLMVMDHAGNVRAHVEDGGVNDVARLVHVVWMIQVGLVAVAVDPHQAGGGDLVEQQAHRVEQEVAVAVRHTRRNMGVDPVYDAEFVAQPVARGEIAADLPFGVADLALEVDIVDFEVGRCGHGGPPRAAR